MCFVRRAPPRNTLQRNPSLKSVLSTLRRMERKIDSLVNTRGGDNPRREQKEVVGTNGGFDAETLLSFPDHLRKSAVTVMKLGRARAEDVAKETGRARAIESAYLNQLARMGHMKKEREGRRVYFLIAGAS